MCGRYTLATRKEEIADQLPLFDVPELEPRYNVAPTQSVAAARIVADGARREIALLRWGLIPSWADDPAIGNRMINARADTVAEKPAFRAAYKKRRCLILADGFFEWQKTGGKKQPYFIHLQDGQLFAFAGLWEHWHRDDQTIASCTIVTTEANDLLRPMHDRMPVILHPADYERWLDPANQTGAGLAELLRPYPAEEMTFHPVSTLVNNPRNDSPECIKPVAA
jgi:putative SOS response-associated peptidase YedK